MTAIVEVQDVHKQYGSGHKALNGVNLEIRQGEILALLGPNGAGKTTLISAICGLTTPTSGTIKVGGFDVQTAYRQARRLIGLVPQEISLEPFETVANTVSFSRGLFGCPPDSKKIDEILKLLSLYDKKNSRIMTLSGGMKRRVLIAKALSHDASILFLDEPTAGVDVELRKDMWHVVDQLRAQGTTIILTTHYIEEAEAIADRIGVINHGEILLVEDKATLMGRLGKKQLRIELQKPLSALPDALKTYELSMSEDGSALLFNYDVQSERTGIASLLSDIKAAKIDLRDIQTSESSLEDIFVDLVKE